jgi:hypothetical protein
LESGSLVLEEAVPTYSDTTRRVFDVALKSLEPEFGKDLHARLSELFAEERATADAIVELLSAPEERADHDH